MSDTLWVIYRWPGEFSDPVWVAAAADNGWLATGPPSSRRFVKLDEHAGNRSASCIRGHVYLNPSEAGGAHY